MHVVVLHCKISLLDFPLPLLLLGSFVIPPCLLLLGKLIKAPLRTKLKLKWIYMSSKRYLTVLVAL